MRGNGNVPPFFWLKMAKKSKKTTKRSGKASGLGGWRLFHTVLVVLGVLILIVAAIGLYEPLQKWLAPAPPPLQVAPIPRAEARPPAAKVLRAEIEHELERWGVPRAGLRSLPEGTPGYQVAADYPGQARCSDLAVRLSALSPVVRVERDVENGRVMVYWRERTLFQLHFLPPKPSRPGKVRVAIIVDDLGRDLAVAERLLAIKAALTFSILPGEAHAHEVAVRAHRRGREVLIHLPMEPEGFPEVNPGADALLVAQNLQDVRIRYNSYRQRVPYAVGGNNHMGSRYTADRAAMQRILELLHEDGLFFIDSRTTPNSVAMDEARALGLAVAGRDLFLDNEADVAKITAQINKLAKLAQRRGQAIGICHPHPETVTALARVVPQLRRHGIEIVAVSALLEGSGGR